MLFCKNGAYIADFDFVFFCCLKACNSIKLLYHGLQ